MNFVVSFSGHRPGKLGGFSAPNPVRDRVIRLLEARLQSIRNEAKSITCISGMALGFDQWAAESCVKLGIPFEAAVPCDGQESKWPWQSRKAYNELLAKATKVTVVCPGEYTTVKMQRRNEWMIDNSVYHLVAWDGSRGGTANFVRYARRVRHSGENLLPVDMWSAVKTGDR